MGPCFYCNTQTFRLAPNSKHPQKYTRDHLIPKRLRGGVKACKMPSARAHLITVTCCNGCNQRKGSMSPESFLYKMGTTTKEKVAAIHRAFSLYRVTLVEAQKSLASKLQ